MRYKFTGYVHQNGNLISNSEMTPQRYIVARDLKRFGISFEEGSVITLEVFFRESSPKFRETGLWTKYSLITDIESLHILEKIR